MNNTKPVKSVIVLTAICLITAALLAGVNYFTSDIIEQNEIKAENEALKTVLSKGDTFSEIELYKDFPANIKKVFRADNGEGFVFRIVTNGYGANLTILCGVSKEGIVTGAVCMASSETLGHEKTFGEKFIGKDINSAKDVDTIAAATKTTTGYKGAVQDALKAFEIIKGGVKA